MALTLAEDPLHAVEVVRPLVLEGRSSDGRVDWLVVKEEAPYGRAEGIGDARPGDFADDVEVDD
jgi:hypothetical protein